MIDQYEAELQSWHNLFANVVYNIVVITMTDNGKANVRS